MLLASSWRINHFPRNPVRGGRPPKDKIVSKVSVVSQGAIFIALVKSARFGVFKIFSVRNKVEVIIK